MPVPPTKREAPRVLLKDLVLVRLRDAILGGHLRPGERLDDGELQDWLGVSRTPLRHAIDQLGLTGLIELHPQRFTRVTTQTAAEAPDAAIAMEAILCGVISTAGPVSRASRTFAHLRSADGALSGGAGAQTFWIHFLNGFIALGQETGNPFMTAVLETFGPTLVFKLGALPAPADDEATRASLGRLVAALQRNDLADTQKSTRQLLVDFGMSESAA
ncbi:GntR family transcriptional regulator [Leifsonia sp. NPDC058230]|uniref:GntR family transcriptional regulator n=1 Tax=Leifsonia sp. NPDC058230 TaxID=3346391 RepID=UPI0036D762A7